MTPLNNLESMVKIWRRWCLVRGSTSHNIGLDDHGSLTQKPRNFAVNRRLGPIFFTPAARYKGLRLPGRTRQPRIGYPSRHHHPRQFGQWGRPPRVGPATEDGCGHVRFFGLRTLLGSVDTRVYWSSGHSCPPLFIGGQDTNY